MLVLFSKLVLTPPDRDWIDRVRRAHDPQHAFVGPHFTLVYPFVGEPAEALIEQVSSAARSTKAFDFRLIEVRPVRDALAPRSHVFLIPGEGADELRALHEELAGCGAQGGQPVALPYVPHVTIAAFAAHDDAEQLAAALGPVDVEGRVQELELAEFDGASLRPVQRFTLTS